MTTSERSISRYNKKVTDLLILRVSYHGLSLILSDMLL